MFWTGFAAGFVACIGLVICDHLLAGFRSERRARASFMATLSEYEQKKALESKSDWETARSLIEIERDRQKPVTNPTNSPFFLLSERSRIDRGGNVLPRSRPPYRCGESLTFKSGVTDETCSEI
jgi:hypothetical protein